MYFFHDDKTQNIETILEIHKLAMKKFRCCELTVMWIGGKSCRSGYETQSLKESLKSENISISQEIKEVLNACWKEIQEAYHCPVLFLEAIVS